MIGVKFTGLSAELSRLNSIAARLQPRLMEAMEISTRDVQEYAREHHRFTTRRGDAERSIATAVEATGTIGAKGEVGTSRLVTIYLHQGTKPHTIVPRSKQVLRWPAGGEFAFAKRVHHPGTKQDPFIYEAADHEQKTIVDRFDRIIKEWE